jgi:hypothetical protein
MIEVECLLTLMLGRTTVPTQQQHGARREQIDAKEGLGRKAGPKMEEEEEEEVVKQWHS